MPPTLEQEIDIFCSVRQNVNRANLDHPHRMRTQSTFQFKERENPIDPQVLKDGIDRLRSLGYSEAPILRHDLFERMIDVVRISHDIRLTFLKPICHFIGKHASRSQGAGGRGDSRAALA